MQPIYYYSLFKNYRMILERVIVSFFHHAMLLIATDWCICTYMYIM